MYQGLNIADFVKAVLVQLRAMGYSKPKKTLAEQLGVDDTTVSKWMNGDTGRLHERSLKALADFAAEIGIAIEEHSKGPILWPAHQPYQEMLSQELEVLFPPARLAHIPPVRIFDRFIQSPFGVVAGPATAHWGWCKHLLGSGAGFIELKTIVADARDPRDEPTLFMFVSEVEPESSGKMRTATFRTRKRNDDLCSGIGINLGMPSPKPDDLVDNLRTLLGYATEGQIVLPSISGCPSQVHSESHFIHSLECAAKLVAIDARSHFLALDISCPIIADYFSTIEKVAGAVSAIRRVAPHCRLLVKIGAAPDSFLSGLMHTVGPLVEGFIAINCVPYRGHTLWDGASVDQGILGVSGSPIKAEALRTVSHLLKLRAASPHLSKLVIIGCGGITAPSDVDLFLDKGVNLVGSQTAILHDPYFIWKVHAHLATKELNAQDQKQRSEEVLAKEFGRALLLLLRKHPDLPQPALRDASVIGILRNLLRSSDVLTAPRRTKSFRHADDILIMIEQHLLKNNLKSND